MSFVFGLYPSSKYAMMNPPLIVWLQEVVQARKRGEADKGAAELSLRQLAKECSERVSEQKKLVEQERERVKAAEDRCEEESMVRTHSFLLGEWRGG